MTLQGMLGTKIARLIKTTKAREVEEEGEVACGRAAVCGTALAYQNGKMLLHCCSTLSWFGRTGNSIYALVHTHLQLCLTVWATHRAYKWTRSASNRIIEQSSQRVIEQSSRQAICPNSQTCISCSLLSFALSLPLSLPPPFSLSLFLSATYRIAAHIRYYSVCEFCISITVIWLAKLLH